MARGRKAAVQAEVPVEEQVVETPVEVTEQETQPVETPVEEQQVVETPAPVEEPAEEGENAPVETEPVPECDTIPVAPAKEEKIEEEKESVPTGIKLKVYDKPTDSIKEKEAFVQHLYGNWYGIKAKLRGKIVGISSLGYVSPIKYKRAEAINYAKKINKLRGFGEEVLVVE